MLLPHPVRTALALLCSYVLIAPLSAQATDYVVSESQCLAPGGLADAILKANANPGTDSINLVPGLTIVDDCSFAGPTRIDDSIFEITDSVVINGNGATFRGNNQFITSSGGVSPLTQTSCPTTDGTVQIIGTSLGLMQVGSRSADNSNLTVTINDLNVSDVSHLVQIRDGATLIMNNVAAERVLDLRQCSQPAVRALGSANVIADGLSIIDFSSFQPLIPNSVISGVSGRLELTNALMDRGIRSSAISWSGDVDIVSSRFFGAGGFTFVGGQARILNSLLFPSESPVSARYSDHIVAAGADVTFEASTVVYRTIECEPFSASATQCQWNPDSTTAVRALNGANITFKDSVLHVQDPLETQFDPLLIERDASSQIIVENSFLQPVDGQDAAAIEATVDRRIGLLLTGADALPVAGPGETSLSTGIYPQTITPITTGAALLVDRLASNNDLLDSRGNIVTTDVLGAPRYDGGFRSIGAVQNHVVPHLTAAINPNTATTADLAWNQPSSPAIAGYDVCFGTGSAPDPLIIGTNCTSVGGTLVAGAGASQTDLSTNVSGLNLNQRYWFLVRAFAQGPTPEPWSNVALATTPAPARGVVSGTVTGLAGSLVLQLNGANDLNLSTNGGFTFPQLLSDGASYSVNIAVQPTGQTCSVANATGTLNAQSSNAVSVTCSADFFAVGGVLNGLDAGETLVVQNNASERLTLANNGAFTFTGSYVFGSNYSVTIAQQPVNDSCSLTNGSGTTGTSNNNVLINCAPVFFTVSGGVAGLPASESITLSNNGGETKTVAGGSPFAFSPQAGGSRFDITIEASPPGRQCTVNNGSGALNGADFGNVAITCSTLAYKVGGAVSGLAAGDSVILSNSTGEQITLSSNGAFEFVSAQPFGSEYDVSVAQQPTAPSETCRVSNGSGSIGAGRVDDIIVTCKLNTFSVGGSVQGLMFGDELSLALNGAEQKTLTGDASFNFTPIADGSDYAVTIAAQPTGQTCQITNGVGTLTGSAISNVLIRCTPNQYQVGGHVTGIVAGDTAILVNNGGDVIIVSADGSFIFPTPVTYGDRYAVQVASQPAQPSESCVVIGGEDNSGAGRVGAGDVKNISVVCAINRFSVGGALQGLEQGETITLQNAAAVEIELSRSGNFSFPDQADGSRYDVAISQQPSAQQCQISNSTGVLAGNDVTNIVVRCDDTRFTVGGSISGLATGQTLVIENSNGEQLNLSSNGSFSFATGLVAGATYNISVATQPAGQQCSVTGGSGTVVNVAVANIAIACTALAPAPAPQNIPTLPVSFLVLLTLAAATVGARGLPRR